jgi:hypothetical protein
MRLAIVDPKTQVVQWAFAEDIQVVARKATVIKNIDNTVAALITDLKHLVTPPVTWSEGSGQIAQSSFAGTERGLSVSVARLMILSRSTKP